MQHETHTEQAHHGTPHHAHHGTTHSEQPHETHAHEAHETHAQHGIGKVSWSMDAQATLHCLTGCAIGEVLGMVIGTALGWGNAPTMILAITLAFLFGYSLTLRGVLKARVGLKAAIRVALAADTLSITVMEVIDNGVIAFWPGAMDAHLADPMFWGVLAFALVAAFIVTLPVNKWMIGRGKGHAVVHQYHH
jgi:hypothetical protein